ncbi:MAG: carbon-nitrogen hydrolase family protein [Solirubrobacterales bacterium]
MTEEPRQSTPTPTDAAMGTLEIAVCQLGSEVGDEEYDPRPANLERAIAAIDEAAAAGAQLVVFGEAFLNGFQTGQWTARYAVSESEEDPFVAALLAAARRRDVHVIMGATTRAGTFPGDVYNSALLLGPPGLIGTYRKAHIGARINAEGIVMEKVWWSPGAELPVFATALGRIGIEICYDVSFPEVARTLTLRGAELIVNVSAASRGREEIWTHSLFTRATENAVWVLHASVVGNQPGAEFFGGSRLFSPDGRVVAEAPRGEEALLRATADVQTLLEVRGRTHPFHNRRPLLYAPIVDPAGACAPPIFPAP